MTDEQCQAVSDALDYVGAMQNMLDQNGNFNSVFKRMVTSATEELRDLLETINMNQTQRQDTMNATQTILRELIYPHAKTVSTFDLGDGNTINMPLTHRDLLNIIRTTLLNILNQEKGEQ